MRFLLCLWLALSSFVLLPSPARADYKLCNATSYVLQGAVGFQAKAAAPDSHSGSHSQGWVRILPGDCASVLAGPIADASYSVFARSIDAHQGPTKYFSGSERFCTLPKDFQIEGRESCALRGYESSDFIHVDTKAGGDWTTTFGEPHKYAPDEARIAGAQRLLRDNGFRIARIDGIVAKATTRSVMAFQRAGGLAPNGTIDDALITQLIAGAEDEQKRMGLDICNKTDYLAWAAVGLSGADDDMSSGWIRVEPHQCAKAIKGRLTQSHYFIYAEASDGQGQTAQLNGRPLIWFGRDSFCTKSTRFEIKGREACAARGFDEKRFMRVETGGRPVFAVTLK